jgi:hypothetical protein
MNSKQKALRMKIGGETTPMALIKRKMAAEKPMSKRNADYKRAMDRAYEETQEYGRIK